MAKDPYKYFRIEARELLDGLKKGALDLEKGDATQDVVARLLRLAHTLKGAARVVKLPAIAERAHAVEDVLEPHRDGAAVERSAIDEVLALVDGATADLNALDAPAKVEGGPAGRAPAIAQTVRVEVEEMDRLLAGVAEVTVQLGTLRRESEGLARAHRFATRAAEHADRAVSLAQRSALGQLREQLAGLERSVTMSVERIGLELAQVRDAANRLRLMPVTTVLTTLEHVARDAARALGKAIVFEARGGETRLDAHVLGALQDALAHVVRNAVAHGIETPAERARLGKPTAGRVELRVERRGAKVTFACSDDGRGIDVEALRRAGPRRPAEEPSPGMDELAKLLLRGGITTTATVDQVSGRAIGLDVVREVASSLKGEVRVRTEPGRGTTFEITVPVSLSSLQSLLVASDGVTGSLPLDAVCATLRVEDAAIARSGATESLLFEGNVIPFAPLGRLLRRPQTSARSRTSWSAVVVRSGTALAAIGVERLLGTADVVVRPLPAQLDADPVVAGASLDAEGNPELVLDPTGLVETARAGGGATRPALPTRLPILVIDDSLTTRMLEQSILESAGYEVALATSAEEGIVMAQRRRFGVFVVDVEMPGMDGFTFVAQTRADAALREVPAILVTSRGSERDRERGREAGAHAYIVKGEFDQAFLLDTIRELNG